MAASSKSEKSKASDKKVFDVAKPGKSAPDATTRPVIVGHKPMIQDPMVNKADTVEETAPEDEKGTVRSAKKIVPLAEQDDVPEETVAEKEEKDPTPEEEAPEEPDTKPEEDGAPAEDEKTEESPAKPDTDESAAVDALASQAVKKKDGELTEEEKKRAEAISKLIEDKTYYVKTGQAHHKRNTRFIIILVILAIAVAGAVLALDAGLVQANVTLPFDLIPN